MDTGVLAWWSDGFVTQDSNTPLLQHSISCAPFTLTTYPSPNSSVAFLLQGVSNRLHYQRPGANNLAHSYGKMCMDFNDLFQSTDISRPWYRSCAKNWFRVMYDDHQAQRPRVKIFAAGTHHAAMPEGYAKFTYTSSLRTLCLCGEYFLQQTRKSQKL